MSPEERYDALVEWATGLSDPASVSARIGRHSGYLSVQISVRADGGKRVSVRVRDAARGARTQYRGVITSHLTDGSPNRFQIKGPNGRYIDWTPERIDAA